MDDLDSQTEHDQPSTLADVSAIVGGGGVITARDQMKDIVELPLLAACEELYDKNIKTLASSANEKDITYGEVYILIDFDTLSDYNKRIAQHYTQPQRDNGHWGGGMTARIAFPVSELTTVDEISMKAVEIARAFKKQPATWIPKRTPESFTATLDQLVEGYCKEGPECQDPQSSVWRDLGYDYDPEKNVFYSRERLKYYFDPEKGIYYYSEEHYKKAHEKIDTEE